MLRYLEHAERLTATAPDTSTDSDTDVLSPAPRLYVSPLHYHHTISALCQAQGFTPAIALYQEMLQRSKVSSKQQQQFLPHPGTLVPLLQVLSQWGEVTHVSALMGICEEVVQMATALSRMSDETFLQLHGGSSGEAGMGGNYHQGVSFYHVFCVIIPCHALRCRVMMMSVPFVVVSSWHRR